MKNEKPKSKLLEKLVNIKNGLKTEAGKKALKELGKSVKELADDMDVFK